MTSAVVPMPVETPDDVPLTCSIPGRFHPGYSLLGRWMRRRFHDERQAEAWFIVTLAGIVVGLAVAQYLAWTVLQLVHPAPSPTVLGLFWAAQLALVLLSGLTCLLGKQPPVTVTFGTDALYLHQKPRVVEVRCDRITAAESISALLFHRHYRRYAETRVFVNRVPPTLLLLHTDDGPVVLGLPEEDRHAVLAHLEARDHTSRYGVNVAG